MITQYLPMQVQPYVSMLGRPFRARWVWSLIWAVGFALIVWYFGALVAIGDYRPLESDMARMVACVAIFVVWAAFNLQVNFKARKTDDRMMRDLTQAGEADKRGDTSADELRQLRERLMEALSTLRKKAGGGGMGRSHLYQLPWYMMIGPPGSGKSTALLTSGLNFPLSNTMGRDPLKGIGGTRNCDWWFTDQAILLDTAGRYTTQDSDPQADQKAWLGFLDLLKTYRTRQPVNGAIVVISLADLMSPDPTERLNHARAIRQRLNELYDSFGIRVPVYVLFTKVDLVPGFVEYFDGLGKADREQVWGMTYPLDDGSAENAGVVTLFPQELEALIARLNERLLERVQQESDIDRRGLVFNFPNQVASLGDAMLEVLTEIFRSSAYDGRPLLRGVYFTSSVQQGMPIDRTMATITSTFGLEPVRLPAHNRQGRAYFLNKLFREVMFAEAAVVSLNPKEEERRRRLRIAAYALAFTMLAVMAYAWTTGYRTNERQVAQINEQLADYEKAVEGIPTQNVADDDLPRVVKPLDILRALPTGLTEEGKDAGSWLTFGLYQGDKLTAVHGNAYHNALNGLLLPRLLVRLQNQIRERQGEDDFTAAALRIYLMLGSHGPLDTTAVRTWMVNDWSSRYPGPSNQAVRDSLGRHLNSLLAGNLAPIALDANLIDQSRRSLEKLTPAERVYALVRQRGDVAQQKQWLPVNHAGGTGERVFTRLSGQPLNDGIPGVYTREGFYKAFLPALDAVQKEVQEQSWVMGDKEGPAAPQMEQVRARVLELYFADYVRVWDEMLNDIRIVPMEDVQQTVTVLNMVSGPDMPMLKLLRAVADETRLSVPPGVDPNDAAAVAAAAANVPVGANGVTQHFQPIADFVTPVDGAPARVEDLLRLLSNAYEELSAVASGPANGQLDMYARASRGGSGGPIQRLSAQVPQLPQPVAAWVGAFSDGISQQSVGGARAQLANLWGGEVGGFCRRAVRGRYPFDAGADTEISVGDFTRLFAPNGMMDKFFNTHLRPLVDTSSARWKWNRVGGTGLGIPGSVLVAFQNAAQIRDAFFPDGGQSPNVTLQVTPIMLDPKATGVRLSSGGQEVEYRHGPQWPTGLKWPAGEADGVARVVFETTSGTPQGLTQTGPWALFRLADKGGVSATGTDTARVSFAADGHNAVFEIRSSTALNPLVLKELREFRCPTSF
ncbi:type VI secretion system membrane subunit TssM [Niveispirillum irakense]|uniref:type VI secretion system membrane subunit TssM n=1 Tax=Niveispirillum irakense TaxID=34011 RepID=UPI000429EA15|nr:type VI secretion system membrane subunit TssM [Niveispirillum irakense]